jgi:hypothetical protein
VRKLHVLSAVGLAFLGLLAVSSAASAACGPGWRVANRLPSASTLFSVSWVRKGAWAVGRREDGSRRTPLILRYDGSRWSHAPVPGNAEIARTYGLSPQAPVVLTGVFARSASDVWAVGSIGGHAAVLRWNGTVWRALPNPGEAAHLSDVVAAGPDNAWAVGYRRRSDTSDTQPLAMHWNGRSWTVVPGTELDIGGRLFAAALPPGSRALWTVGWYGLGPDDPGVIERYRAGSWTHMFPPTRGLFGVTAIAWNDLWAVGEHDHHQPGGSAIAVHWDGRGWSAVPTPAAEPAHRHDLNAVSAVSPNNVWAVGTTSSQGRGEALIERWDGQAWSVVPAPRGIDRGLIDVSMGRYRYGWAVGNTMKDGSWTGVILRYCPG